MDQSSSSLLLDIDGLVVDRVVRDDAGRRVVHCSTDPQLAGWCPECGEQSTTPKAWVMTPGLRTWCRNLACDSLVRFDRIVQL